MREAEEEEDEDESMREAEMVGNPSAESNCFVSNQGGGEEVIYIHEPYARALTLIPHTVAVTLDTKQRSY